MPDATAGFELRDHTADIVLFAWGPTMDDLFRAAADGLYATIGELRDRGQKQAVRITLKGNDINDLLHDFLTELHYLFEVKAQRLSNFTFQRSDDSAMEVSASAADVDPDASIYDREVKAVTYHDLRIAERDGRYEVAVIWDI